MKTIETFVKEYFDDPIEYLKLNNIITTKEVISKLIEDYSNMVIDECAENAEADYTVIPFNIGESIEVYVVKQSILKVKELLK